MKKVCSWCGKHISGKKDDPDITHGICPKCKKRVEREAREYLKKWIRREKDE